MLNRATLSQRHFAGKHERRRPQKPESIKLEHVSGAAVESKVPDRETPGGPGEPSLPGLAGGGPWQRRFYSCLGLAGRPAR
jgi:hypothetical protein